MYFFPGWLLSAFFCGYILTQIPGGWLAHKYGAKYVYGIGIVMTAIFTLLTPIAADISVWALVAVRALEGLFEVTKLIMCQCDTDPMLRKWLLLHTIAIMDGTIIIITIDVKIEM